MLSLFSLHHASLHQVVTEVTNQIAGARKEQGSAAQTKFLESLPEGSRNTIFAVCWVLLLPPPLYFLGFLWGAVVFYECRRTGMWKRVPCGHFWDGV